MIAFFKITIIRFYNFNNFIITFFFFKDFGVTVGQPLQEEVETMLVGSMQALDETIAGK